MYKYIYLHKYVYEMHGINFSKYTRLMTQKCIYIYIRKDVQLYDIFNFDKISDKMDDDKQIINIVLDKNEVTEF